MAKDVKPAKNADKVIPTIHKVLTSILFPLLEILKIKSVLAIQQIKATIP